MALSKDKAFTGKYWKYKLVHVEYNNDGKVTARHEFFHLDHIHLVKRVVVVVATVAIAIIIIPIIPIISVILALAH